MAYLKKPSTGEYSNDWRPWTTARFHTERDRDDFLRSVADTVDSGWHAEAMTANGLGAQVRWRRGRFLGLNDVAYAHGGRIAVGIVNHRVF